MSIRLKGFVACAILCALSTVAAQERRPNFRDIIRANLEHFDAMSEEHDRQHGSFPFAVQIIPRETYPSVSNVQTSDIARTVTTNLYGPAWQTCIRATMGKIQRTIAVFVHDNHVIDSRTALALDGCDAGKYVPLPIHRSGGKPLKKHR